MSDATSDEASALLGSADGIRTIVKRQVRRSWAIGVALITFGVLLLGGASIQGAFTPTTKQTEIPQNDDHPYSIRVVYLYMFVVGNAVQAIIAGITILRAISVDDLNVERELRWAAMDIHGSSAAGMATSTISGIASLIAIISFQDNKSGEEFQFNITQSVGWIIIGCMCLLLMGLFSASELDARVLMGENSKNHTSRARATTVIQMHFAVQVVVVGIPLVCTALESGVLLVFTVLFTLAAPLFGFISSYLVLSQLRFEKWPAAVKFLHLDRSWGTSTAAHCLCLIACGLHIFLGAEAVYNCRDNSRTHDTFDPNCDANIGELAAILPFVFNAVALVMLGITSVFAAVRLGALSREYSRGRFNATDELLHTSTFTQLYHDMSGGEVALTAHENPLSALTPEELASAFNELVPNSGNMLVEANISGSVVAVMLSAVDHPFKPTPQTVEVMSEVAHCELSRMDCAKLLAFVKQNSIVPSTRATSRRVSVSHTINE